MEWCMAIFFFFFNDTATTEIYTLSLHDALPISDDLGGVNLDLGDIVGVSGVATKTKRGEPSLAVSELVLLGKIRTPLPDTFHGLTDTARERSEEHTSELQSLRHLVCRLLLEKKK